MGTRHSNVSCRKHCVDLAFAMTFNKSQWQTLHKVVLEFNAISNKDNGREGISVGMPPIDRESVYTALMRVRCGEDIRIIPKWKENSHDYLFKGKTLKI